MTRRIFEPKAHTNGLRTFCRSENGSFSIEAIIWMPIFAILLAIIMNVTMVFHSEARMLRLVQDANRAFSLGRFADDAEVEAFITAGLAYLDADLFVDTQINGGIVSTLVRTNASELMPFNFMTAAFDGIDVGVFAQHIIEF